MPEKPKEQQPIVESELRRFEPVTDDTVLAAVDRAHRHDPHQQHRERAGAPVAQIAKHLGFLRTGWTTRQLRPQLDALVAEGVLGVSRRDRICFWAPTKTGRERLVALHRARRFPTLPESPQHQAWRLARASAGEHIADLSMRLQHDLTAAAALLEGYRDVPSDEWFVLGERLSRRCTLLGTATHCLSEWKEPDDSRADIDLQQDPGDEQLTEPVRNQRRGLRRARRDLVRRLREDEDAHTRLQEPGPRPGRVAAAVLPADQI